MDSYYTSPAIADELADNDTGLCGTVNCNCRGMPRGLTPAELPLRKGEDPVFSRNNKLFPCACYDTKRVITHIQKRIRVKESHTAFLEVKKPFCVDNYNSLMEGVDAADQRMKTYLFPGSGTGESSVQFLVSVWSMLISSTAG